MTSGLSIFLIAVGAILYFAVSASVRGLNLNAVGIILMIVGTLGLVLSVVVLAAARARGPRMTVTDGTSPAQRSTTVTTEDLR